MVLWKIGAPPVLQDGAAHGYELIRAALEVGLPRR